MEDLAGHNEAEPDLDGNKKGRAKGAPELDDPKHAALVQELADKVKEVCKAVEAAGMEGHR